jgi:subtilisin family serine protease
MERIEIERLIYGEPEQQRRFTQDFPILPDVWIQFAQHPDDRLQLLLTPHNRSDAAVLARALRERLEKEKPSIEKYRRAHAPKRTDAKKPELSARILSNEAVVLAEFTFEELIRVAIPLTDWWRTSIATVARNGLNIVDVIAKLRRPKVKHKTVDPRLLSKMIVIIGAIECDRYKKNAKATAIPPEHPGGVPARAMNALDEPTKAQMDAFATLLENLTHPGENRGLLYSISRNREAKTSIWRSRNAVKADAASRLFEVDTAGIYWAVLDTGIDATHAAFARWENNKRVTAHQTDENGKKVFPTRIIRTYDFLRLKDLLDPGMDQINSAGTYAEQLGKKKLAELKEELKHNRENRAIDWDLLEPFLRIPHTAQEYAKYRKLLQDGNDSHGTHVAGIIAANWPDAKTDTSVGKEFFGICPHLEIYDLRVLGPGADEFTVIAALQFVRHLNAHKDLMSIHGVNLSMAVAHDVANYACGRTPVCEECERVVANGVVIVSAAGNRGFNKLATVEDGAMGDYRFISITDPGNAENVITVGSTHRSMPHNYGVSYFSSRGPTGDGRTKPDLVAPGERIDSCALGGDFETMDGTSMAAPHVSGAAAMLIARHRELMGQPRRVKEILCKSATDLGREPRFQGAGMVDVLRALQSV